MDNIAEGFERGSNGEFRSFLSYAKGSYGEVRSQLYRCMDLGFINEAQFLCYREETEFIAGKRFRIIAHLNTFSHKGQRFK